MKPSALLAQGTADQVARLLTPEPERPPPTDPVAWIHGTLGRHAWSKQREIARSVVEHRRTMVPACHGPGKTALAAMVAGWWEEAHEDPFIVTTAPTGRQVAALLWREIARVHRDAGLPGVINTGTDSASWQVGPPGGRELIGWGRKPQDFADPIRAMQAFQGIHALNVLVILDEACHDDRTEVLTDSGWRFFRDLDGSEDLLTMDPETRQAEYRPPTSLHRAHRRGPMIEYLGKGASFCVTPDHSMLYRRYRHRRREYGPWRRAAAEVAVRDGSWLQRTVVWSEPDAPLFVLPAFRTGRKHFPARALPMDDWMTFLGWYFSEGHIAYGRGRPTAVGITQADPDVLDEITALLRTLGFRPKRYERSVRAHDMQLAAFLDECGRGCLEKAIPACVRFASARQIGLFLDAFIRGDGYQRSGRDVMYTSSERLAGDLQELSLKLGFNSTVRKRPLLNARPSINGRTIRASRDGYVVSRLAGAKDLRIRGTHRRVIDYDGMVYCAHVPPHHLMLTRRDGYVVWSGNTGVPEWLWDAADSLLTNENARILAIGNPDDATSRFASECAPGSSANVIRISAFDTPNFTGEPVPEHLRALLTSRTWVLEQEAKWGKDNPLYQSKIEARFPDVSDDKVISPRLVQRAWACDLPGDEPGAYGLDVARFGRDKTVLYRVRGGVARLIAEWHKQDTTVTVDKVEVLTRHAPAVPIVVDADGVGGPVFDFGVRGRNAAGRPLPMKPFTLNTSPRDKRRFASRRSEVWWNYRERMDEGLVDLDPADLDLAAQLQQPKWTLDSRGRIVVETKEQMAARGLPSPDRADACIMAEEDAPRIMRPPYAPNRPPAPGGRRTLTGDLLRRTM